MELDSRGDLERSAFNKNHRVDLAVDALARGNASEQMPALQDNAALTHKALLTGNAVLLSSRPRHGL